MISIQVIGGIGNQLFQIFATLAYGIQTNVQVVFPSHNGTHKRITYWDTLFSGLQSYTTDSMENPPDIDSFVPYKEPDFIYTPIPDFGDQSTKLDGFFQSFRYFEEVQSTLYDYIHLYDKQAEILDKYPQYFAGKETVCMHFRLGDYKNKRYYHPIMNYEYFEEALRFVTQQTSTVSRVLYLCEKADNEYVEGQIHRLRETFPTLEYVKIEDDIPDYEQLLMMSCCHHNIMSNSTFSWWGAYMNQHPNKVVCYPSVWFGQYFEHTPSCQDLMKPEWMKIESNPKHYKEPL
jgi:hypothetical protein